MVRRRKRHTESPAQRLREWARRSDISITEALAAHGYLISEQHADQILSGEKPPGENFIQAFYEATGIRLSRI